MTQFGTDSTDEIRYVSTKQVAQALGVSTSTVKRWVDEGVLPGRKTIGGHRKLLVADVIRFVKQADLPRADLGHLLETPAASPAPDAEALREEFFKALQAADTEVVRSLIHGAYQNRYTLQSLADEIIAPAMTRLGHDWETGRIEVFHEHRATQTVVAALYELKGLQQQQPSAELPVAVGGAPEHDHSILPTLLAEMVLFDCGWGAVNLGAHTPFSAFHRSLDDLSPKLIWLSVSHVLDPELFQAEYRELYQRAQAVGVPVAIGGSGLTEAMRRELPYTFYGDGFKHLADFARTLHPGPVLPRRGRPAQN